jgi:hypothetical protein
MLIIFKMPIPTFKEALPTSVAIFSSERKLHKDYYRNGSVGKINLWSWVARGLAPRQTDLW